MELSSTVQTFGLFMTSLHYEMRLRKRRMCVSVLSLGSIKAVALGATVDLAVPTLLPTL